MDDLGRRRTERRRTNPEHGSSEALDLFRTGSPSPASTSAPVSNVPYANRCAVMRDPARSRLTLIAAPVASAGWMPPTQSCVEDQQIRREVPEREYKAAIRHERPPRRASQGAVSTVSPHV